MAAKRCERDAETEAAAVHGEAHRLGQLAVAVGQHHDGVADVLVLAPGAHDEGVVDRDADHLVGALGPELLGAQDEARAGGGPSRSA